MLINMRNALMAGKRLPYDAEVEYLESTGTQYIDTGILCNQTTVVECGFYWTTTSYNMNTFGVFDNSSGTAKRFMVQIYESNPPNSYWGETTPFMSSSASRGIWHDTFFGNRTWEVDGATVQSWSAETFQMTVPLYLFARRTKNVATPSVDHDSFFRGRISYARIKQDGVLVRDFIPVRKGTVGYLYDRVSGKLFGNAGTGAFTYGNDLKYPIPAE